MKLFSHSLLNPSFAFASSFWVSLSIYGSSSKTLPVGFPEVWYENPIHFHSFAPIFNSLLQRVPKACIQTRSLP